MNLKGFVLIEKSRDGKVIETIEQENQICQASLVELLFYNSIDNYFGQRRISISTQNTTPDTNVNQLTQVIATGFVPVGITSPQWFEGVIPPFGQVRNRFNPPIASRTFSTVALANQSTNNNQASITAIAYCYLLLDIPCTQTNLDTVDITYRIQFSNDSDSGFLNKEAVTKDFGKTLFGNATKNPGFQMGTMAISPFQKSSLAWSNIFISGGDPTCRRGFSVIGWDAANTGAIASHFKWKYIFNQLRTSTVGLGRIFNLLLLGAGETVNDGVYGWSEYQYDKAPFQLGFWHGAASVNPFFDANAFGSSNGKPTLSGNWAGGFPQLFRVNIVNLSNTNSASIAKNATSVSLAIAVAFQLPIGTSLFFANGITVVLSAIANVGDLTVSISPAPDPVPSGTACTYTPGTETGQALYTWSVRRHLGFNGSTYTDLALIGNPYKYYAAQPIEGIHGWTETDNDVLRFSNTQVVQYDQDGVSLLDVSNGSLSNFDTLTTPALPVSDVRQCATDGNLIYVACRNTGLWIINIAANTISNPISTNCFGVDIGRIGTAWAIFNGSLRNSLNWATSRTFTFTGLTDANWNRARFLKCDPGQSDDQLAIIADNGAGTNRVIWYRSSTAIATLGFSSALIKSFPASLDCSDGGGFWAMQNRRLTFASAATVSLGSVPVVTLTSPIYGSDTFYKISFFNNDLIGSSSTLSQTNTVVKYYTTLPPSSFVTHMGGGIVLGSRIMRQLITDNTNYEHYGWNGSAWDTGVTTPKQTHANAQSLGSGISIAFENGLTAPSFTPTDYFTQGLNHGLWKSNATDIYFSCAWYSKPVSFNFPVQAAAIAANGLILSAAADLNYQRIESDDRTLSAFLLDGFPVANIYFTAIAPGVNEVTINPITAEVTFNAADLGKTFTGTYAWIRFA